MERVPEIERRWIVHEMQPCEPRPSERRWPSEYDFVGHIRQGYQDELGGTRIRLIGKRAVLTHKSGYGLSRFEENMAVSADDGEAMLLRSPFRLSKNRFIRDSWEVDFFTGSLRGLVIAEREMQTADTPVQLPPWIHRATEVTNTVSNSLLARLSYDMSDSRDDQPKDLEWLITMLLHPPKRIVLTGGPCSGKSAAIRELTAANPDLFHVVPEVATIVIGQVQTPPFGVSDRIRNRRFNRSMCTIQRLFEDLALERAMCDGRQALIIDRGVMDNAAYVVDGIAGLENTCRTTRALEHSRYDAVVFIEMPGREVYERCMAGNPTRHESFEDAQRLGETVFDCWIDHPNLIVVPDAPTWAEKSERVRRVVRHILNS